MTPRLLIVSPSFHGYHAAIARSFERLGYQTSTYCYDAVDSLAEKTWNKVRHELPAHLFGGHSHQSPETVSRRAVERVHAVAPEIVLVIRGDTLTEDFWEAAGRRGRPVVVWMYDEMRRTSFEPDLVSRYARIASYSPQDTVDLVQSGIEALHVPLGYDDTTTPSASQIGSGTVSFLGAPSPTRLSGLLALQRAGLPVRAWGRGWSNHPYDRARTWRVRASRIPSGRDVPSSLAHTIMKNSIATLNFHGDQDGFTMRTFEAAGSQAVQVIDRADVEMYYEPSREVLVQQDAEELVETVRQVFSNPGKYQRLRKEARNRTLAEHTLTHRARHLEQLW